MLRSVLEGEMGVERECQIKKKITKVKIEHLYMNNTEKALKINTQEV